MTSPAAEAVSQTKIVRVEEVTRSYGGGATQVHALRGVSFTITRGELVALRGRSGSGKTTLLSIIGGLERPSSGRVEVDGRLGPVGYTVRYPPALGAATVTVTTTADAPAGTPARSVTVRFRTARAATGWCAVRVSSRRLGVTER